MSAADQVYRYAINLPCDWINPKPLDALQVGDEVCAHFKDFGDCDHRPAREVASANENTEVRSVIEVGIMISVPCFQTYLPKGKGVLNHAFPRPTILAK